MIDRLDHLVSIISRNRDALKEYYLFALPPEEMVDTLMEKTRFHEWALGNGFPVPESHVVTCHAALKEVLCSIRYPAVLKPLVRTAKWNKQSPVHKVYRLEKKEDIAKIPFDVFSAVPEILVQQWIGEI